MQYNLQYYDKERTEGIYQMPILQGARHIPYGLIGFNYALNQGDKRKGIHFYVDDSQFERVWRCPERYMKVLKQYNCALTPDFSLYLNMPLPMKIWNVYRNRLIGQIMQDCGIVTIPTVSWAEPETFAFCFDGLPENSVLSVSTIGVKRNKEAFAVWQSGMDELIFRKHPSTLLVYGGEVAYDYKGTSVVYFQNEVTERMRRNRS